MNHTFIEIPHWPPSSTNFWWCNRCGVLKVGEEGRPEYFVPGHDVSFTRRGNPLGQINEPPCLGRDS